MSAGATTERVLIALRHLLASRVGAWHTPRPAMLAQRLGASATPLREALHLLTGEGLVESRAGGGFNLPFLDAAGLRSSYEWSEQVLCLAIRHWPRRRRDRPAPAPTDGIDGIGDIADRCAALFLHIGRQSSNREHARAIGRLNAQLRHVRLTEERVIERLDEELQTLTDAILTGDRSMAVRLISNYHRIRQKLCTNIVNASYNASCKH
jgi:DNA-binding GntR family transcriptional regulator